MPRSALDRFVPVVFLGAALAILLLPRIVDPWIAPASWSTGASELRVRVGIAHLLAGLAVVAGLVWVGWRFAHEPKVGIRAGAGLLAAGLVVAGLAALPVYDDLTQEALAARHASNGGLVPMPSTTMGHLQAPGGGSVSFELPRVQVAPLDEARIMLGTVSLARGDLWQVQLMLHDIVPATFEQPNLVAGGLDCTMHSSGMSDGPVGAYSSVWHCVATEHGVATMAILLGTTQAERHEHRVSMISVMHGVHTSRLDESALAVGAVAILGVTALAAAWAPKLHGRDAALAEALAAAGLASAGIAWMVLLAGRADVVGTTGASTLLLTGVGVVLALACAATAWRSGRLRSRGWWQGAAVVAMATSLLAPSTLLAHLAGTHVSPGGVLAAGVAMLVVALFVTARWSLSPRLPEGPEALESVR